MKSRGSYAALDELEVYIREDYSVNTQTPYVNAHGAAYILHEVDQQSVYEFDQVFEKNMTFDNPLNDGKNLKPPMYLNSNKIQEKQSENDVKTSLIGNKENFIARTAN